METITHSIYKMPINWRERVEAICKSHTFTPNKNDVYLKALEHGLAQLEREVREIKSNE